MPKFPFLLLCFSLFIPFLEIFSQPALADPAAQDAYQETDGQVQALLQQANQDYCQRDQAGKIQSAIDCYQQVLQLQPRHYETLWRLAQCYFWLGEQFSHDRVQSQIPIFSAGLNMAKRALDVSPNAPEGNFWYGLLLGSVSANRGAGEKLAAVNTIVKSMETVIRCDPKQGFAYHVLGLLYRMAPGWPFSCGNLDKSLQYARLAVEKRPDVVLMHVGLAETLLAKGKKDEAKNELKQALALPGPPDYQPETQREKARAEELLKKIQG